MTESNSNSRPVMPELLSDNPVNLRIDSSQAITPCGDDSSGGQYPFYLPIEKIVIKPVQSLGNSDEINRPVF